MTENTVLDNNTSSIIKKEETVPVLRFSEFDTFWDKISFIDTFDILQNNTYSRADLNYKSGSTKNIHYGDILVKFDECIDVQHKSVPFINVENNLSKFKLESYLKNGDIIIADTAEDEIVGKVAEISNIREQKVLSGLHTIPCRPKRKFAPMFLGFYMNSQSFHKQLIPLITGIKVSSISKTSIATTTISVPLFEEQEKISKFMIVISRMIKEQESKISILETYNRGLISKIFKQEIRFKDNDGNDYPKWIKMPLEENIELIIDNRGKTPPLSQNGYPLIEINAVGDFFVNYSKIEKYVNENIYHTWFRKHLKKGDILFSTVGTTALCSCYDEKQICCVAQNIVGLRFQKNIDNIFMYYLLTEKENNKYIKSIQMNGVQPSIKITQFTKLKFPIPCLEEQEKIANFLTSLDNVLQEEKNYFEYLKTIKKGILQQMFV